MIAALYAAATALAAPLLRRMLARRAVRGFTLVELIFFLVVLALGLTGILAVSTGAVANSADPQARKQALAIAESLVEGRRKESPASLRLGASAGAVTTIVLNSVGKVARVNSAANALGVNASAMQIVIRFNCITTSPLKCELWLIWRK